MSSEPEKPSADESAPRDESFYIKLPAGPQITSSEALRTERELLEGLKTQGPRAETLKPLAVFYSRVGQQETAYRYLQTWMKQAKPPEELAECLLMCGQLAEQVEQHKSAAAFYREGLELKPTQPGVAYFLRNNLAYCLNRQAEYAQAAHLCREAIALDDSRPNAFKNLGESLLGLGQFAEAAATWIRAIHVDVADARSLALLEDLLAGHREEVKLFVPDIEEKVAECRRAVESAKTGRFADWARGLTYN